jgi:hypothetical protein
MPLQNRVTPFGEIITDPARGTVMGNRGNLHDVGDKILRPYQATRWIICRLEFKGRRRPQMPPGAWTSLFFLDEATALAAGHRPCFECNREKARAFAEHWVAANPLHGRSEKTGSDLIDEQLHRERISDAYYLRDRRKRVYLDVIDGLPDGTFVALGPELAPFLVQGPHVLPWSSQGYGTPAKRPTSLMVVVLTPSSTVRALAHGYRPDLHPTAGDEALRDS